MSTKSILVHRWVLWWFYVGVVCGAVAVVNILFRELARGQERLIIVIGIIFWLLGGLVCWASGGVRIEKPPPQPQNQPMPSVSQRREWHAASEFVLPGAGHALLPLARMRHHQDLLSYLRQHRGVTRNPQSVK